MLLCLSWSVRGQVKLCVCVCVWKAVEQVDACLHISHLLSMLIILVDTLIMHKYCIYVSTSMWERVIFFRALLDLFGLGPSHFIFFCLSALTFPARINMKINHSTRKHKGLARRIYSKFVWHFNGPIISSFRRRMFAFCSACCLPFWWARAFAVAVAVVVALYIVICLCLFGF